MKLNAETIRMVDDEQLARYLGALANPRRLAVLRTLADGETSVNQLAACVGISQSALSQHLAILRSQQLVKFRREAQTIFYSLSNQKSSQALSLVNDILFPCGLQMSMLGYFDSNAASG